MKNKLKIEDKLRSSGLRPTKQRVRIAQFLFEREKTFHFTVEELDKLINSKIEFLPIFIIQHMPLKKLVI